ncbi:Uncharacterised protein [Mycobacterium tuberculosis]|uniref:Uncharacterized protein n=1 Tax=Mycobacterium tuberculosis TaxID=1773 RepID=A0A654U4V8_MYCTX|nr:Uncharacterised protein [Mycobacterium tuberculosis]CFR98243.1 Uncharacterised protein [Mycobacterium tuberculosis]CKQ93285.1 Uncharacterised protein [Mycobacterium tuberculosis]CKR59748.1 Uncharacterised protein [Mycobacterium tuberculosis]CNV54040.1 Uncharacterised protein [Mycobacterium tuberculosis]
MYSGLYLNSRLVVGARMSAAPTRLSRLLPSRLVPALDSPMALSSKASSCVE